MKGEIRFVGTSIPEIRKLLIEKNSSEGLDQLPMNQQVSFVNGLMRSELAEHKLLYPALLAGKSEGHISFEPYFRLV